ncbi:SDR family oxidoreductase [Actinomadura luteofluorescens]|uniref:NAD(P)-dependent dehydrogenase (Short-subunit alcohol dehydrogenase family) n=1 Tax=Actinomadura luteofluorescens TaxID=46163 RepID=A0A7Y9ERJ9_9ACTN|nr:SDR family oxidoreductase [Actinomadura luteofluorescens]NYD52632.1 NAD(P)-dependent dehydrogenase (short-subunit alcohol dehydrogenase family) [Actinomadura luteofluorescens]
MNVLITGGASGLGAAVARKVADDGGRPLILDRHPPKEDFEHMQADLADRRCAERAVHCLARAAGGLNAVVTAAGIDARGALCEVPAEDWERVVQVNLLGTAAVARAALPYLENEPHGRIVTVASTLGLRAKGDATAYCASTSGVVGFTRALAAETAGKVAVTLVVPGGMDTAFFDDRADKYKPGPETRLSRPEDVAATIAFALAQPSGCEVRELVVCPSEEPSWP